MNNKPQPIEIEWLEHLRSSGVIDAEVYAQLRTMLDRKGTRSHVVSFMNRMMEEHPDEWQLFKTKMRVLGRC